MKRRRIIAVLIAVIVMGVITGALVWREPREPEPEYNGKRLSEWLEVGRNREAEAYDAIRHMGTNALPVLFGWLSYEPNPMRKKFFSGLRSCLPKRITKATSFYYLAVGRGGRRKLEAQGCFGVIGGAAAPELAKFMMQARSRNKAESAGWVLVCMGEEAIPALVAALEDRAQPGRQIVVKLIGNFPDRFGTNVARTVPILVSNMQERDGELVQEAARTLGKLQLEAGLAVPALVSGLHNELSEVRVTSAIALSRFGQDARMAVPALLTAAGTDGDADVKEAAERALRKIAPETGGTNGVDHL